MNKIDVQDVLILTGLPMTGVGLFFWFGEGPALSVCGLIILGLGLFGRR